MIKDPRKDELKREWREQERQKLIASIPMHRQALRDLFDHLDGEAAEDCDHTLRVTTEFLRQRGLDVERIILWLHEHGGSCDCEVLANVEGTFSDVLEE
jgi:hypothetical protein